jgi:3-oxoacyl-[acyl-carrier protein] reductase
MRSFEGRVAIITGAAGGIGRAVGAALVRRGAQVVLVDVDRDAVERMAAEHGGAAVALVADAGNPATAEDAVEQARSRFGRLDFVHANAGIGVDKRAVDLTAAEWQRVLDVNLTGPFLLARAALREFERRNHAGSIVFTSSTHAAVTSPATAAYASSKAALLGLTRTLALEGASTGIRVNAVLPGATATAMVENFIVASANPDAVREQFARTSPLGRLAEPREIAAAVVFLLSDDASFVTGTSLAVDGGLLASMATAVAYD